MKYHAIVLDSMVADGGAYEVLQLFIFISERVVYAILVAEKPVVRLIFKRKETAHICIAKIHFQKFCECKGDLLVNHDNGFTKRLKNHAGNYCTGHRLKHAVFRGYRFLKLRRDKE
jgi:hypothetical protein